LIFSYKKNLISIVFDFNNIKDIIWKLNYRFMFTEFEDGLALV